MSSILIRNGADNVNAIATNFDNELELERVLVEHPGLLLAHGDRQLALVARQVTLRGAGCLDILCVDEEGLPVAVEVKLARNYESRRTVIAQVVDYLSSLTSLTVDELDADVDDALEQALRSFEPDNDEAFERRWRSLGANLRAGIGRMILALDSAPSDLERIVRFLSERRLDVRLITIAKYADPHVGLIYVPTIVIANEQNAISTKKVLPVEPSSYLAAWGQRYGQANVECWHALVTAAQQANPRFRLGHYDRGGPYIYCELAGHPEVPIVRLESRAPRVRDRLNKLIWTTSPTLMTARDDFRESATKALGATVFGRERRVSIPLTAVSSNEALIEAMNRLVANLHD